MDKDLHIEALEALVGKLKSEILELQNSGEESFTVTTELIKIALKHVDRKKFTKEILDSKQLTDYRKEDLIGFADDCC